MYTIFNNIVTNGMLDMSNRYLDVRYGDEISRCCICRWDGRMFYISLGWQDVPYGVEITGCSICR